MVVTLAPQLVFTFLPFIFAASTCRDPVELLFTPTATVPPKKLRVLGHDQRLQKW